MFHGSSGTGEQFYNTSKWKERGEIEKFITVFPTALEYCVLNYPNNNPARITRWNNGSLIEDKCPNVAQTFKDDVKFIRKMVDTIKQTFTVNPKKIFGSGFSNGGVMVAKLAMDAPDVFAAVANVGSMMHELDSLKPAKTIPIWSMVGSLDDRFTTAIGLPEIPFGGDSCLGYMQRGINRFLVCESLTQVYTKNNTPLTNSFLFTNRLVITNTNRYIFTLVKGLIHQYPNGDNFPLVAADLHWEFFKQSVSTDVKDIPLPESAVSLYPNPSHDAITVEMLENKTNTEGGVVQFSIFNTLGQQVFLRQQAPNTSFVVYKKDIGEGLFIVKIKQGNAIATKRLVFE